MLLRKLGLTESIRIKKAYRKKALELHPDRNYGNVEASTHLFAEIQSAYEVLSDPQERAWYDSHRDAVLYDDAIPTGQHPQGTVRGTSTVDIFRLIARINGCLDYSDSPDGFFAVIREAFSTIAQEERVACDWEGLDVVDYPSFGHSNDNYDNVVRPFYAVWMGFSTRKSFSWLDAYRPPEESGRRVRRIVEKENKRLRDEGIREYNDAVRSLVAFIRKRDPRYVPNKQTEEERQKVLRNAAAAQAARSRAAYQAKLNRQVQPDWMNPQEADESEDDEEENEQEVDEHFECVACEKTFKSEKQFETHEKSKKHLKAVKDLQRKMRKDNKELNLDPSVNRMVQSTSAIPELSTDSESILVDGARHPDPDISNIKAAAESPDTDNIEKQQDSLVGSTSHSSDAEKDKDEGKLGPAASSGPDDSQDEYAPRHEVESRILGNEPTDVMAGRTNEHGVAEDPDSDLLSENATKLSLQETQDETSSQKVGKAKQKRAKKAAQRGGTAQASNEVNIFTSILHRISY